jgi:3'-phosphoadenosine 5'-phosphosulfate sulfotransferase (PAPS reductase)/FAD synthetase
MSCALTESERRYEMQVPVGYWTLSSMPDFLFSEWVDTVRVAGQRGQLRPALAQKIINSLLRMPELLEGQTAIQSFSYGKDSEASTMLVRMKYPADRILGLFADTKDEWQETYDFMPVFQDWVDFPIVTLESEGLHENIRRKGFFPKPNQRWCTKELKMLTQRDYMDDQGYDQVRGDRRPASLRDSRGKTEYEVKYPAPILFAGERWAESAERAKLPFDARTVELLRWTHRPVLDWTIHDVWEFIFWMQAPFNQVYLNDIKRCACAGCIFADPQEFRLLGEYHPDHLKRWAETEEIVGVDFKPKRFSIRELYAEMEAAGQLGSRANVRAQITDHIRHQLYKQLDHWYHYWSETWTDDRIAERVKSEFMRFSTKYEEDKEYRDFIDSIDMLQVCRDYRADHEIPDPSNTEEMTAWNEEFRKESKRKQLQILRSITSENLWVRLFNGFAYDDQDEQLVKLLQDGNDAAAAQWFKNRAGLGGSGTYGDHWGWSEYGPKGWEIKLNDGRHLKKTHKQMVDFYKEEFYPLRKNDYILKAIDKETVGV